MARRKPYTEIGLKRVSCTRCDDPATQQVRFPIDGYWRPLCTECDVELNIIYLVFMQIPSVDIDEAIERYRDD